MAPTDSTTLAEARTWLRERVDDGERCPLCTQLAKVYRRKLNATNARLLIEAYRAHRLQPFHAPSTLGGRAGGEWARLTLWNLIAEVDAARDDGGRAGWWAVTRTGEAFLRGTLTVPKYARVYDGRCLGLVGEQVTISDALGEPFDLRELMAA